MDTNKREHLVKRHLPVQPWDMTGLEHWFSSMAEQGLYLRKISQNWAIFQPGTPKVGVRYALDITGPADIDLERNENYTQMGWDYVTTLVNLYYVYRSDVPDAPALHTDPVTQSKTIPPLIRRLRRILVLCLLCLLFGFRGTLLAMYSNPWSLVQYLLLRTEYALLFALFLTPCVCLLLIPQIRQLHALRKLRRQLADGIPLDQNRRWPRKFSPTLLTYGILLFLLLTVATRLWLEPRLAQTLTDTDGTSLPHLTLVETLDSEDVRIVPESPYDKMLHPNTFRRSLLVPEQLEWSESGTVLSPDFTNEAWVSVSYYCVRLPRTAPILLSGLTAEFRQKLSAFQRQQDELVTHPSTLTVLQEFQPASGSDFDQLLMLEYRTDDDPVTRCYVGRIGPEVFRLVCRGIPDPDRCLTQLAGQMR